MSQENTPASEQTFDQQVNAVVDSMVQTSEGKWELPAELEVPEHLRFCAVAERRRRDTQAAYTRTKQEAAAYKLEKEELAKNLEEFTRQSLTADQKSELDELKYSDPEAWRAKLDQLEAEAQTKYEERKKSISAKAQQQIELERRKELLDAYNEANPEHVITDEIVTNDIPPRYVQQLDKGEITFDEFLVKCGTFLKGGKAVQKSEAPDDVDLSKVGGGSKPSKEAVAKDIQASYKNEIY